MLDACQPLLFDCCQDATVLYERGRGIVEARRNPQHQHRGQDTRIQNAQGIGPPRRPTNSELPGHTDRCRKVEYPGNAAQ